MKARADMKARLRSVMPKPGVRSFHVDSHDQTAGKCCSAESTDGDILDTSGKMDTWIVRFKECIFSSAISLRFPRNGATVLSFPLTDGARIPVGIIGMLSALGTHLQKIDRGYSGDVAFIGGSHPAGSDYSGRGGPLLADWEEG